MTVTAERSILADRELIDMLASEPELLAIADALVATTRPATARSARWTRTRLASVAATLALVAAGAALLSLSRWEGAPDLAERALAAVGTGPVLHVQLEQSTTPSQSLVDLRDGSVIPRQLRTEIWFDGGRGLKKTVVALDGHRLDEFLETNEGGWTQGGPIYTCAWIAAHPAEATKAGVSCNANGENPATPRAIPEQPPTLDPVLSNFVDRYQAALASGAAAEVGRGEVDGHAVVWLQFADSGPAGRVAIDGTTFKPLLIETRGVTHRVRLAETVAYAPGIFSRPQPAEPQFIGGAVKSETDVSPEQAAAELGGTALWLGRDWNGLRLVSVTRQQRTVRYGDQPTEISTFAFTYAPVAANDSVELSARVEIYETTTCLVRVGWSCTPRDPTTSTVLGLPFGPDGWIGLLRRDGVYVSIWNVHPERGSTLLDIARALTPVSGDG